MTGPQYPEGFHLSHPLLLPSYFNPNVAYLCQDKNCRFQIAGFRLRLFTLLHSPLLTPLGFPLILQPNQHSAISAQPEKEWFLLFNNDSSESLSEIPQPTEYLFLQYFLTWSCCDIFFSDSWLLTAECSRSIVVVEQKTSGNISWHPLPFRLWGLGRRAKGYFG